jgi:hypothetical protein
MTTCLCCGANTKNPKYCSKSCAATVNNQATGRAKPGPKSKKKPRQCAYCPGTIPAPSPNKLYCSTACKSAAQFDNTLLRYRAGDNHLHPETLKKCLIHCEGNMCIKCGNAGIHKDEPLVLQLDHIDGNTDNCLPTNLRLLCPNCHSQTPTFCFKGKTHKNTKRDNSRRKHYHALRQSRTVI